MTDENANGAADPQNDAPAETLKDAAGDAQGAATPQPQVRTLYPARAEVTALSER